MSTTIRLKVQVGSDENNQYDRNPIQILKFIYIIESPFQKTIDDLCHDLQTYINEHYLPTNIEILRLTTVDGFQFNRFDKCSNVFQNNDHILCIDMKAFVLEVYPTIDFDSPWFVMKQHDPSDDKEKSIQIGLNNFARLYVRFWVDPDRNSIYLFNFLDLMKINREQKKNLIGRLEDTEWFLEAQWNYEKDLSIICKMKIGAEDQIYSNKIHIQLNQKEKQIEQGEIISLSNETNDQQTTRTEQQQKRLKELIANLPPPQRSGPQINIRPPSANVKLSKYDCEGESSIRMAVGNTNTITIYQNNRQHNEEFFRQYFTISHIIFSKKAQILPEILQQKRSQPADKPVSVMNVAVLYQTHDEAWHESQNVAIAPTTVRNEEPKWLAESIINIEPDKLVSFTISGSISVKGESGQDAQSRRRSHKSLPQPLRLKIVITDNFTRQCFLIVEQLNPPLNLITRQSFMKDNQSNISELIAFVTVDDCETDERLAAMMYFNREKALVIKNSDSRYQTFEQKTIRTMEFNARKARTAEVEFEFLSYKYQFNACTITGLFDNESYSLYAVRFQLSTRTSKTDETHSILL